MYNINNGCYEVCTNCSRSGKCCSSFDKINEPVMNMQELIQIRATLKKDDFYEKLNENLYKIKINNGECIFFKNGRCSIYKNRPLDCKLYPFDIIKKDSGYYLVLYELGCIKDSQMVDSFDCIDSLIDEIKPWIIDYTDDRNYTKMKRLKYKVIKEVRE